MEGEVIQGVKVTVASQLPDEMGKPTQQVQLLIAVGHGQVTIVTRLESALDVDLLIIALEAHRERVWGRR